MDAQSLKNMLDAMDSKLLNHRVSDKEDNPEEQARVCGLTLKMKPIATQADLAEAFGTFVADFPEASGWLCRQSDVVWFRNGQVPLDANIQYGELVGDDLQSLLIRPDGKGGLRLIYQTETAGQTHLAVPHRHIGRHRPPTGDPVGELVYRTYWTKQKDSDAGGYRAETTRLVRMSKGEAQ